MVESTPGTEATKVLQSSGTSTPAGGTRPVTGSRCPFSVGTRWRDYKIDAPASSGAPNVFEATHVGRMEKVLISASLLSKFTAARRQVWDQLSTRLPADVRILKSLEAHEEGGWRYEISNLPPVTSLRDWIACHQAEDWAQKQFLEQLSASLSALHSLGIVHLNIRPENIYLSGEGDRMDTLLGGLETAVAYKQAAQIPTVVDPFYAPPEAIDPDGRPPGFGLCAWDWWSVGRVIQEMILGRHVMSMLFGSDVIRNPTAALRERAKALLLEQEPPGMRAGAVESMPDLTLAMKAMLRGLLTSARDARWGGDSIRQWLAKENVANHYDLARNARFFVWNERGRTLLEAAQYFRAEENWADGELNIFAPENPETLANFLSSVPAHAADWKKMQEIVAHGAAPDWAGIPEPARRAVVAALTWQTFGPQPGALVVKGRRIDAVGLAELLSAGQDSGNLEIIRALLSAPCLALIAALDPAAAEVLKQLALIGGEALKKAETCGWIDPLDASSQAYILKLSLEPEPALRKRADRTRGAFATCQNPELAAMLVEKNPTTLMQILLVVTGENPRRFGYVTRAEFARQEVARLRDRAREINVGLFWLHLKGMLVSGRPWSGSWRMFLIFWLALIGFGLLVSRDIETTTGLALALVGLRLLLAWRVRKLVAHCDAGASPPWNWRDGPERCLTEARRAQSSAVTPSIPNLNRQLSEIERSILGLAPDENKKSPSHVPHLSGLWPVFGLAAFICVLGSVLLLKNIGRKVGLQALSVAWNSTPPEPQAGAGARYTPDTPEQIEALLHTLPGLAPEMADRVRRGEYEIVKESFGCTLHGPIKQWAFSPPAVVPPLPVESVAPATAAQRAFALVSGELLLRPYGRKGVTAMFVVRVPTKDGFGLMVYNAKSRKLVDNQALILREGLPDNSWYKFERYNVIYLGAPSQMEAGRENILSQR